MSRLLLDLFNATFRPELGDSLPLQLRLDDLGLKLEGDERALVWEARSRINLLEDRLARIRAEAS